MLPYLRIAAYCVAVPLVLTVGLFLVWLALWIGGATEGALLCMALLGAVGILLGMVSVGVGAIALAICLWKGLRDHEGSRRTVVMRVLPTVGLMVAYIVVGCFLVGTIVRTVVGPRRPSESVHEAVGRKDPRIEELTQFLDEDPDAVHARDEYGYTPLHHAARPSGRELADLLIVRGADVNARSQDGDTPLHAAAGSERAAEVTRLLIAHGAEINAANDEGEVPLHRAARWSCVENVRLLLEEGADPNVENVEGDTPLDAAIRQWERQVDVWKEGDWNGSAESWERSIGEWEECIELLRQHGGRMTSTTWPQERPRPVG